MKVHPNAIIEDGAELDHGVEVGPWCRVGAKVKIGKNTKLHSHVVIEGSTVIGEGNSIYPFAVLGAIPQDLKYRGEDTQLVIGNHNVIREGVNIHIGTVQDRGITEIGNHNLIMGYCHIGHDCMIGNHCILANMVGLAGHVKLQDHVNVGGMSGVGQFVRIGMNAYIGGFSAVEKDILPFSIAVGTRPIALRGVNIVGLRRRGYTAEVIQVLNETIKLWCRTDVHKEQCLLEIESQYGEYSEVKQLLTFIRSSDSGVIK